MRYKHDSDPKNGETRTRKEFLLFPVTLFVGATHEKETRWWEDVVVLQQCNHYTDGKIKWEDVCFVDSEQDEAAFLENGWHGKYGRSSPTAVGEVK